MSFRFFLNRIPATPLAVVVAGAGFFALQHRSTLGSTATVAYAEDIHHPVAATSTGRIAELRVHVGQSVKANEPIATMDDKETVAARKKAMRQLEKLEADVAAAVLDEESKVTRAELWVLKARADERGDRAELEEVSRRVQRLDGLLEKHMVEANSAEQAREKKRTLEARVKAYDAAIGSGQAALRDVDANHIRNVEARLEPFRKAVLVQRAAVEELDLALDQLLLRAPCDGVVSTLEHRSGDVVSAGVPIVSVVSARAGTVVAIVPESAVTHVASGAVAEIRRGGLFSRAVRGKVIELAPEIEEMPERARPSPSIAAWGRRATIGLEGAEAILPGEAFHVSFR